MSPPLKFLRIALHHLGFLHDSASTYAYTNNVCLNLCATGRFPPRECILNTYIHIYACLKYFMKFVYVHVPAE